MDSVISWPQDRAHILLCTKLAVTVEQQKAIKCSKEKYCRTIETDTFWLLGDGYYFRFIKAAFFYRKQPINQSIQSHAAFSHTQVFCIIRNRHHSLWTSVSSEYTKALMSDAGIRAHICSS